MRRPAAARSSASSATIAGAGAGMLFPMCDCGSRLLAHRLCTLGLREAGIAFLIVAPLINPIVIVTRWLAFRDVELVILWLLTVFLIAMTAVIAMRLVQSHHRPDAQSRCPASCGRRIPPARALGILRTAGIARRRVCACGGPQQFPRKITWPGRGKYDHQDRSAVQSGRLQGWCLPSNSRYPPLRLHGYCQLAINQLRLNYPVDIRLVRYMIPGQAPFAGRGPTSI